MAASACPTSTKPVTYQFITIPAPQIAPGKAQVRSTWDPTTDTAYGSVDISANGNTITFANIHQFTLPSAGGTGAPAQQTASPATGACASTFYGETISLPYPLTISNPGNNPGNPQSVPPQATVGIGPTGLLVEDNGTSTTNTLDTLPGTSLGLYYDNVLGAGTGAIGLPEPSSALDTGTLIGAQYLGFVYGAGVYSSSSSGGWSSHLASFGFLSVPSGCSAIAPSSATLIYGGDYTNDDPSTSADGYGNCDLAVDLGAQDPFDNGLYPHATIWMGADYAANTTGKTYSFPAVAIAGQLNGKYAIFLIGTDATQPWLIYLLQSN